MKTFSARARNFSAIACLMALSLVSPALAELLVYEGFDYELSDNTDLAGEAVTGTGLTGNWGGSASNDVFYETTGLTYGKLITKAGAAFADSTGLLNADLATVVTDAITPADDGTNTVWMSFLAQRASGTGDQWQGVALDRSTGNTSMNAITLNSSGNEMGAKGGNAATTTETLSPTIGADETVFILGKLDLTRSADGNTDSVDLIAYRFSGGVLPTSESGLTGGISSSDSSDFERFPAMVQIIGSYGDYRFDEIRVGLDDDGGSDFGGVMPMIPEPGAITLLGLGAVMFLGRRRNRSRA